MPLRVFALAVGRVGEPGRGSRVRTRRTIVAEINTTAAPRLRVRVSGWLHRPTSPTSSDLTRLLRERRSPTGDTTASGPQTSKSVHAPAALDRPGRDQSDGLAPALAQSCRIPRSTVWDAHDESP